MLTDGNERYIHASQAVYAECVREDVSLHVTSVHCACHVYSVCLLDVSDHLSPEQRSRFKTLDDNMDFLSQELRRDVITDYLRQRDLLTEDQYQHIISS